MSIKFSSIEGQEKNSLTNIKEDKKTLEKTINNLVDRINVFKNISSEKLKIADVLILDEFLESREFDEYILLAKEYLLSGKYVPEFIFAGAATRLLNSLEKILDKKLNPSDYRMYGLDLWKVVEILKNNSQIVRKNSPELAEKMQYVTLSNEQKNLGMGPRQILAYKKFLIQLANEEDLDEQEIIENQKIILHINEEVANDVLNDFLENNFYGFDPKNVFFIVQPIFSGFTIKDKEINYNSESNKLPYGHGYVAMQLNQSNQGFTLDKQGDRNYISESVLDYLLSKNVKLIGTHRVNDLTKFLVSEIVDLNKIAFGLYQINQGKDIIIELVENPSGQKGGNLIQDIETGKKFLIETSNTKGSENLTKLLNEAGKKNCPYNAFRLIYEPKSLKRLLAKGLPYNLRFKNNHFYLEAVTGDITQLPDAKSEAFKKEAEIIRDFKSLDNLPEAIDYLKKSDIEFEIQIFPQNVETEIKFGTSGWRARTDIGEFNIDTVGRIAKAVAEEFLDQTSKKEYVPVNHKEGLRILVAYDGRSGSKEYAQRVVEVLSSYGIITHMSNEISTTPSVIAQTRESLGENAYDLGLHLTASHNDDRYNGIKVLQKGVVAPDSLTSRFAKRINESENKRYRRIPFEKLDVKKKNIVRDTLERYDLTFPNLLEDFAFYKKRNPEFEIVIDVMHGSAGPFTEIFEKIGAQIIRKTPMKENTYPKKNFIEDGQQKRYRPEPKEIFLDFEKFENFKKNANEGSLYIAIDGDGDRVACWIKYGRKVIELTPNELGILYGWYLHKYQRTINAPYICKTLPTTYGIEALAKWAEKKLAITPVGSKHFAPYMKDSSNKKALIATEESGHQGMTIGDQTWFDDAICQTLLLIEIISVTDMDLIENLKKVQNEIGFKSLYKRLNKDLTEELKNQIVYPLKKNPKELIEIIEDSYQKKVSRVFITTQNDEVLPLEKIEIDDLEIKVNEGIYIQFRDNSWAQIRLSGTEPIARIYTEAQTEEDRNALEKAVIYAIEKGSFFASKKFEKLDSRISKEKFEDLESHEFIEFANLKIDSLIDHFRNSFIGLLKDFNKIDNLN